MYLFSCGRGLRWAGCSSQLVAAVPEVMLGGRMKHTQVIQKNGVDIITYVHGDIEDMFMEILR